MGWQWNGRGYGWVESGFVVMAIFVKRALVSALGVFLGSYLLPGIHFEDYGSLVVAVLLLGIFSAILKPVLVLFALPFVVLTMGIGLLVINALLYSFASYLVEGFTVDGFGYAFFGAFIISILNVIFNNWINGGRRRTRVSVRRGANRDRSSDPKVRRQTFSEGRAMRSNDDVIDI